MRNNFVSGMEPNVYQQRLSGKKPQEAPIDESGPGVILGLMKLRIRSRQKLTSLVLREISLEIRARMGSWIWQGMLKNGLTIGMWQITIQRLHRKIPPDRTQELIKLLGAVLI